MDTMLNPVLYSKGKKGEIRFWKVWTEGPEIVTEHGVVDGKVQQARKTAKAKNVGKKNETTPQEQAINQANSMWQKQIDKGYFDSIEKAENTEVFLPMLASKFEDKKHKLSYPCCVQPKLDGCLFRKNRIQTSEGLKTIEDIVESKLKVDVLSHNEKTGDYEYKPVVNWFNNGQAHYTEWLELVPQFGKPLKCTKNHKVLTQRGFVEAQDLDPKEDKILSNQYRPYLTGLMTGTVLGDSIIVVESRGSGNAYRLVFSHTNKELLDFKLKVLGLEGRVEQYMTGYGSQAWRFVSTALTNSSFPVNYFYFTGHNDQCGKRKVVSARALRQFLTKEGLALWIADDGSLNYNNGNVETPRLSIHTERYPEDQIEEFVKYFQREWGLTPFVNVANKVNSTPGKFLTFSTKDTFYLLTFLRHCAVEGVEYKFFYPIEGYVRPAEDVFTYSQFHIRNSRRMPDAVKYDIEVADNHNYVAEGAVVHNCRALAYWEDDKVKLMSRAGKPYDVEHIRSACEQFLGKRQVFDGEIYIHGTPLQDINSLVKKPQEDSQVLEYWIYDTFYRHNLDLDWNTRLTELEVLYKLKGFTESPLKKVPWGLVSEESLIRKAEHYWVEAGYEGAIVREFSAPYEIGKRSNYLLKVKSFMDEEFPIVGFKEGEGKFSGCVIWECETKEGRRFHATPKGTMKQRAEWYQNGERYIGKLLTVKFFQYTNDMIPQFPVGLAIRLEEDL